MFCKECGKEIADDSKFCQYCGTKFEKEEKIEEKMQENIEEKNASDKKVEDILKKLNEEGAKKENPKQKNTKFIIMLGILIFIGIIIIISKIVNQGTNLKKAFNNVSEKYPNYYLYMSCPDDGSYIRIDTNPNDEDDFYEASTWGMIVDLNEELELPASLLEKMSQTRAMDGRITETIEDITISWTYHPNDGLEVLYEKK